MTTAERKAGKHERIKQLLDNLHVTQPKPVAEDQLPMGDIVEIPSPS